MPPPRQGQGQGGRSVSAASSSSSHNPTERRRSSIRNSLSGNSERTSESQLEKSAVVVMVVKMEGGAITRPQPVLGVSDSDSGRDSPLLPPAAGSSSASGSRRGSNGRNSSRYPVLQRVYPDYEKEPPPSAPVIACIRGRERERE